MRHQIESEAGIPAYRLKLEQTNREVDWRSEGTELCSQEYQVSQLCGTVGKLIAFYYSY